MQQTRYTLFFLIGGLVLLFILFFLFSDQSDSTDEITLYSGRSKALVDPIIDKFEEQTGTTVRVRYGSSTQLAVALMEEGERTPADLFWAQDAGALGAISNEGMFATLPDRFTDGLPQNFQSARQEWLATSGRARVLAYSSERVERDELPGSIYELDREQWSGRIGWAPGNASFQAFVTALRKMHGDAQAQEWLQALRNNGVQQYPNNSSLIEAIAAGEIDLALTNHYYLFRYRERNDDYPVDQTFFEPGDAGNLVNVAGIGTLDISEKQELAHEFIEFLLSEESQRYFTREVFEYPVVEGLNPGNDGLLDFELMRQRSPAIELDQLDDLDATLNLLREEGLL